MRTTLTLDDDVAAKLEQLSRGSGRSFKAVVNETLRHGLLANQSHASPGRFKVQTRRLGLRQGLSYDNIGDLLEEIERAR